MTAFVSSLGALFLACNDECRGDRGLGFKSEKERKAVFNILPLPGVCKNILGFL